MRVEIHPSYSNDEITSFLKRLPVVFDVEGETLYEGRNVVKRFVLPSTQKVVVKRFKKPNFIQMIAYGFFVKTKAMRAFLHASILRERGFDTPHEIAYIEERPSGLLAHCYFISEEDNAPPIHERLVEQEPFDHVMADDFALFAASLHHKNILHDDLNSTNVLYRKLENGHYSFSLIDTNRMRVKPLDKTFSKHEYLENLTRFTWQDELFVYVLKKYIECMSWDNEHHFALGIRIKGQHDERWKRRKAFLKMFK